MELLSPDSLASADLFFIYFIYNGKIYKREFHNGICTNKASQILLHNWHLILHLFHLFSEFLSCGKRWCKSNVEATETKFTRVEGIVSWLLWLCLYRSHYAHIRHFLWRDVWCKPQLKHVFRSFSEIIWLFPFLNFMILLGAEGMCSRKCAHIIQFLNMNCFIFESHI